MDREKGQRMEAVGHKTRMGFNLIEAAIVLGVVGAVIGTIWVSAANMYENHKVNKTVEGIFSTARNIQNLISIRDAEAIGNTNLLPLLVSAKAFPDNWIKTAGFVQAPIGSFVSTVSEYYVQYGNTFAIVLYGVPKADCINLVVRISDVGSVNLNNAAWGSDNRPFLAEVFVNNPANPPATSFRDFPISPEDANTACVPVVNNHIYGVFMYFNYTRINN